MGVQLDSIEAFSTARLTARRIQPQDFDDWRRMHQNEVVMATLGGLIDDQLTRQMLAENIEHWKQHGFGRWMFHARADGSFVGRGGLKKVTIEDRDEVEVGYALMPQFWGRGLATEIAAASIQVAFTQLGLCELVCFTLPTNLASRRVMEKCGFRFQRDFVWKELPHVLYRLEQNHFHHRANQKRH